MFTWRYEQEPKTFGSVGIHLFSTRGALFFYFVFLIFTSLNFLPYSEQVATTPAGMPTFSSDSTLLEAERDSLTRKAEFADYHVYAQ